MDIDKLLNRIREYNPNADIKLIKKSYDVALKAHKGQKRESGEPYISHPLNVAKILTELKADSATISAALLHDVVEDTNVSMDKIKKDFGEEVATIVEGLTKIDKIHFETKEDYSAENLRKVLLATTKDIRVMLVKLADRLHNMSTLKNFRTDKQKRIATETLEIYAPIAHKLGMWNMKGELEDLSLRYLKPDVYRFLADNISGKRQEREKTTKEIIKLINKKLKEKNITAEIYGRAKYFLSIYKKMQKKNLDIDEIYDLIAVRIITQTIPECYGALGVVHDLWRPLPHRFKDYISVPKANGYQSLHTTVITKDGRKLEVQIRTEDMHQMAEVGVAAHWKYQGTERDKQFDKRISWLKQVLDWKRGSDDAKDFIESFKIDLFHDEIVVFTPKGDPISLPVGSSPIDFAYAVHSNVGKQCSSTKINNKMVPLDTELKSGDIIEIITQKNAKPSRQWLKFVKTGKARNKIRAALNIKSELDPKKGRLRKEMIQASEEKVVDQIIIEGKKKGQVKFSKCCNPRYGEEIVAFFTKDKKITVHKKTCPNIYTLDKNKEIKIKWKVRRTKEQYLIVISIGDRLGLMSEILNVFVKHRINLTAINTKAKKDHVVIKINIDKIARNVVDDLIIDIKKLSDVMDVALS